MSVKKIFITLIVVVCCVILGAFVINILLPNVTTTLINAVEAEIFNATGMNFDFNADGAAGETSDGNYTGDRTGGTDKIAADDSVNGFQ